MLRETIVLLDNLLNRKSLRNLKLDLFCTIDVAATNFAPNLTSISLCGVEIVNPDPSTSTLSLTLPVLTTLEISHCQWLNVKSVEFHASSLTTFRSGTKFHASSLTTFISRPKHDAGESDYSIVILGDRLATLECSGGSPNNIIIPHVSSIVSVLFDYATEAQDQSLTNIWSQVRTLLDRVSNFKTLQLTHHNLAETIVLPGNLLNSTSLRELKLNMSCTLNAAAMNLAPALTSMNLHGVQIVNGDSNTSTVILTFPVLKTLEISHCQWLNVKCVVIHAVSLTELISKTKSDAGESDYSIVIMGDMLERFVCSGGLPENITIQNGSSVVSARLDCEINIQDHQSLRYVGLHVRMLLDGFSNLESLVLPSTFAKALRFEPPLRQKDKLRQLILRNPSNTEQVLNLLYAAPSLNSLYIDMVFWDDYEHYDTIEVPSCIASHLEEVEIADFYGDECQYKLVEFLLKNGKKLKSILLANDPVPEMRNEIEERLSALPKVSSCSIIVENCDY